MQHIKNCLKEYNELSIEKDMIETRLKDYTDRRQNYIRELEGIENKLNYILHKNNTSYPMFVQFKKDVKTELFNMDREYGPYYTKNLRANLTDVKNKLNVLKDSYLQLISNMLKEDLNEEASVLFNEIIDEKTYGNTYYG